MDSELPDPPAVEPQSISPVFMLALQASFGSVERWREDLLAIAATHRGGWLRLELSPVSARLVHRHVDAPDAPSKHVPLLALECAVRDELERRIERIDWAAVERRHVEALERVSRPWGIDAGLLSGGMRCIDVRRAAVYRQAEATLPHAGWRDPAEIERWAGELTPAEPVVVYCVYGHEVSHAAALRMRAAGIDARFLRGGIEGWREQGLPLAAKQEPQPGPAGSGRAGSRARLAILSPGDRAARDRADNKSGRFAALFEAFAAAGVDAEPAIYHDDFADEVRDQLLRRQGVLVWHNPIEGGRSRARLDALLREVAAQGVFVATHPDTIDALGTKDVLLALRDEPFGSDVHRIDSLAGLQHELPRRLDAGPRVLKQQRGHSGIGVWRVERQSAGRHLLQEAARGAPIEPLDSAGLVRRLAPYVDGGSHLIDQAWQPRMVEGMTRAYLVGDRVAGFGHQAVIALHPAPAGLPAPAPGPRLYSGPGDERFQGLRRRLEQGWVAQIARATGVAHDRLPLLWDLDFLPGAGEDDWVLCEINVSSVSPFPDAAIAPLVRATVERLRTAGG